MCHIWAWCTIFCGYDRLPKVTKKNLRFHFKAYFAWILYILPWSVFEHYRLSNHIRYFTSSIVIIYSKYFNIIKNRNMT